MKANILSIATIAIMILFGACSNEDLVEQNNPEATPKAQHTLQLTASMPSDNPTTRVALEQQPNKSIALSWQADDVLHLAFVKEGITTTIVEASIKTLSDDKKRAQFNIDIPEAFQTGAFATYGVYGGGGIEVDQDNMPLAKLPAYAGTATSLDGEEATSIQNRKDIMLHFSSTDIDANDPNLSITFQHLGSLFCVTLKNSDTYELGNNRGISLYLEGDGSWCYNGGEGNQRYNLAKGEFINRESAISYLTLGTATKPLPAGETISLWGWYPPLPNANWPQLQLRLWSYIGTSPTYIDSNNTLPPRTTPTAAGKSYYMYAVWDGAELYFTNETFTNNLTIDVAQAGTLHELLSATQQAITTKLTLTGKINEADYAVMKSMHKLTHIDLKETTSYQGATANRIPHSALGDETPESANKAIKTVVLPKNTTTIGAFAFANCKNLEGTLAIPTNVTTIEKGAFYKCASLTNELSIPTKVSAIGASAFEHCTNIEAFLFPFTTPMTYTANMLTEGKPVKVPASARSIYRETEGWKNHTIIGYIGLGVGLPGM